MRNSIIFQRGRLKPPTRYALNRVCQEMMGGILGEPIEKSHDLSWERKGDGV